MRAEQPKSPAQVLENKEKIKKMTQQKNKQTAANIPTAIVGALRRNHLKANEHNRQKLADLAEKFGESWATVSACDIEPISQKNGGGFFVWLRKNDERGNPYEYINNPAERVEGLQEMTPAEWIANTLATITPKTWQEGKTRPAFKVERLKDNRPNTLAEYMNNRPALRVWFVFIHKEQDGSGRRSWDAVCGTFDPETKTDQGGQPCDQFQGVNKWRNRKQAAEVYAITTQRAPAQQARAIKTQRNENRPAPSYWRYKKIKIDTSTHNGKQRAESITAQQVGGGFAPIVRRSFGGVCYSSEWKYNNAEEISAEYFDKSGNLIKETKEKLLRRAYALKIERQEQAAKVHEFAPDIERLNQRAATLGNLIQQITAEFINNRSAEDWGAFYYIYLNKRIANQLEECHEIANKCRRKEWRNIANFMEREEQSKKSAEALGVVVAEWLKLTPAERGHDAPKERAIYYGAYNIQGGALVYDFAKLEGRP